MVKKLKQCEMFQAKVCRKKYKQCPTLKHYKNCNHFISYNTATFSLGWCLMPERGVGFYGH